MDWLLRVCLYSMDLVSPVYRSTEFGDAFKLQCTRSDVPPFCSVGNPMLLEVVVDIEETLNNQQYSASPPPQSRHPSKFVGMAFVLDATDAVRCFHQTC